MKRYPVKSKELAKGTKVEMKEHPTMNERMARRTARQQLQAHPTFYQIMPIAEKMMQDRERNIRPIRKPHPRPQSVTGFSGRLL
jgi:hypothetical protein